MDIEAVLLTGGASRRMGEDKARLVIDGVPQAERVARPLLDLGLRVTVLGRGPLNGCEFLPDEKEFGGPLSAIGRFTPQADFVFVASCDLPRFDGRLVGLLRERIEQTGAAAPFVNGYRQPLCALFRASAFAGIPKVLEQDHACAMAWLDSVPHVLVSEDEIAAAGIDPQSAQGANTQQELAQMLQREH